jgi:alkylhydroperoxidase/carboxymuconolactone decarboxylase family protein YurZ
VANFVDDNGNSCFVDDNAVTVWVDDNGNILTCLGDTVDELVANDITSQSSVGAPVFTQGQVLLAEDIQAQSSVSVPMLNRPTSGDEGTGHWRGKGGGKGKKARTYEGQPQRIRRLSELDPPLFTPQEVIEAVTPPVTLDDQSRSLIMDAALASVQNVNNILAKQRVDLRREREDEFMLMQ